MLNKKEAAKIATSFVNAAQEAAPKRYSKMKDFMLKHADDIRPSMRHDPQLLHNIAWSLRSAWMKSHWPVAEENIEQILQSDKAGVIQRQPVGQAVAYPNDETPFERAAFVTKLGEIRPVFKRRDILDEIAYAILRAASKGLLRTCEGHRRGFGCPTPLLVADEKRRRFCYKACGDESTFRSKKKWDQENR